MPRPRKCRFIGPGPRVTVFKPGGVPGHLLETIQLGLDELEALRLADVEGLYQDAAAQQMGISRATFGRVLQSARWKVATALLEGRKLVFEGGPVTSEPVRHFICAACGAHFELAPGGGPPTACPQCSSPQVGRADQPGVNVPPGGCCGRGHGRRRGRCGGPHGNDSAGRMGRRGLWGQPAGDAEPPAQKNDGG